MRKNNITDEKELIYGIKTYLINSGSYHYPFLHPDKIKRMATTGEWTKSYETGILYTRTDKKDLVHRAIRKMI